MHPQFYSIFYQKEKLLSYDMVLENFRRKKGFIGAKVKEYEIWQLNVIVDQEYWEKRALKRQEFTSRIFAILKDFLWEKMKEVKKNFLYFFLKWVKK